MKDEERKQRKRKQKGELKRSDGVKERIGKKKKRRSTLHFT